MGTRLYSKWLYHDVEYTGRWKIIKVNDGSELYLECFEFKEKEVPCHILAEIKVLTGLLWWKKWETRFEVIRSTKRILSVHPLGWIPEHTLEVFVTEEFINECGSNG